MTKITSFTGETAGRSSHTVSLPRNLCATGDCSFSKYVVSELLSERGVAAGVIAGVRFTNRVRAAFRIEMRLLRETSRVLVYLPKVISKHARMREQREGMVVQFPENGRSSKENQKPDM